MIRTGIVVFAASFLSLTSAVAQPSANLGHAIPPVTVSDAEGKPVAGSLAALINKQRPAMALKPTSADASGKITFKFEGDQPAALPDGEYSLLVIAPGKAHQAVDFSLPTSAPLNVKMEDGQPLEIHLKPAAGTAIPADLKPLIYPQPFSAAFVNETDSPATATVAKIIEPGKYQVNLTPTTAPLRIAIDHPGFLRAFDTPLDSATALTSKVVEIALPPPASISVNLGVPPRLASDVTTRTIIYKLYRQVRFGENSGMYSPFAEIAQPGNNLTTQTFSHLAPGKYGMTASEKEEVTADGTPAFSADALVELTAGQSASQIFPYDRFDPSFLEGNGTANIQVKRQDGSPYANQAVQLRYRSPQFGTYVITSGTLDAEGRIEIAGLAPVVANTTGYRLHDSKDTMLGVFAFNPGQTSQTVVFKVPPSVGDVAPDIELKDITSAATFKLSDFRGQVVLLDFWATWCPPCQEPMSHNQSILEKKGDAWKGKAVILAASIDEDMNSVIRHVKMKGWELMKHGWAAPGGFSSKAPATYGVSSIPKGFLIDKQGKIVWIGHPGSMDLEAEVEKLLAQ